MNKKLVGDGKVVLISGGDKVYTDTAARFVRSERSLDEIIASEYDKNIVKRILESGHKAALEFDYFIFGTEGYSRVTETQLVRKRHASFMIKTGRADKDGKRSFDVVVPGAVQDVSIMYRNKDGIEMEISADDILNISERWYEKGVELGKKEEELRYYKPQATEFKAIIGMNAHALLDFFAIRCCANAQAEIRDMALKMMTLCKQASPDIFVDAGPNCKMLGYCPENGMRNAKCKVITKSEFMNKSEG